MLENYAPSPKKPYSGRTMNTLLLLRMTSRPSTSSRLTRRTLPVVLAIVTASCLGCNDPSPNADLDVLGFVIPEPPAAPADRKWVEPAFEVFSIGADLEQPGGLYTPRGMTLSQSGDLFVSDFGDMTVKRYAASGEFVRSYGSHRGSGPGELVNMTDLEVMGDSAIAVLDTGNRRIVIFDLDSTSSTSVSLTKGVSRLAVTEGGRHYALLRDAESAFQTWHASQDVQSADLVGRLLADPIGNGMRASGRLETIGEDLIYASTYYPLLMRFSANGDLVYARATPDFAGFEGGAAVTNQGFGDQLIRRVSGPRLHGKVRLSDSRLYLHARYDSTRVSTAMDIYRAEDGEYLESVKVPYASYLLGTKDSIYSLSPTSVVLYRFTSNQR